MEQRQVNQSNLGANVIVPTSSAAANPPSNGTTNQSINDPINGSAHSLNATPHSVMGSDNSVLNTAAVVSDNEADWDTADESENEEPATVIGAGLQPGYEPVVGTQTSHSIGDMDLTNVTQHLNLPHGQRPQTPSHSWLLQHIQGDLYAMRQDQQAFQTRILDQVHQLKAEQAGRISELAKSLITLPRNLTQLYEKGKNDIVIAMDKQFDYHRTQIISAVQWRLKTHHDELLQEVNAPNSPVLSSVSLLQQEIAQCNQSLTDLSADVTILKQRSLHPTSVVATSIPSIGRHATFSRQQQTTPPIPLQSTMHPGPENLDFHGTSPFTSIIPPDSPTHTSSHSRRSGGALPIKLEFPTFGKKDDSPDPLLYLERCRDFLALNPLADGELLATLRNVLHGTARDWWNVARLNTQTWADFENKFSSAFLSEDYTDELADRVRNRVQGEKESIRDFAYSYYSLCKRWKPEIQEDEVIKLILKNINPLLASQLRERATTVDGLVRLGQQFEKDRECQQQYDHRTRPSNRQPNKPPNQSQPHQPETTANVGLFCWRCNKKGHAPESCYSLQPNHSRNPNKSTQNQSSNPHSQQSTNHPTISTLTQPERPRENAYVHPSIVPPQRPIPRQLVWPLSVGRWTGTAILDTGSSYTLLNEQLWKDVKDKNQKLHPWVEGPLYLADGEAKQPLGWSPVVFQLNNQRYEIPTVILPAKTLAFPAVLGLDFMYMSGVQMDITHNAYWFPHNPGKKYSFLSDGAKLQDWRPTVAFVSAVAPVLLDQKLQDWRPTVAFFSAVAPVLLDQDKTVEDLLELAVKRAKLEEYEEFMLLEQLRRNSDVCTKLVGRTGLLKHKIHLTPDNIPVKQKPYRLSPAKYRIQHELIQEMLDKDVIERSMSPWASPVVLIPKKTGDYRFCVDYRKLNSITQNDAYPLPTINEILESLSGSAIFTTLDLNSGYWQVEMDPASRDMTAFVCAEGLFHFKVMPFGLKNAPATFQRLMETALGELKGTICFVYLDDIIIYSKTRQKHIQDLQQVLDKLREAGLTVNLKKSNFCQTSLKFLGHIVSATGIEVDPAKTLAVQDLPVPSNLKALQRFLGMAGWYHRYVPNFSQIADPLNALKRKGVKFKWTAECQTAFVTLKHHLVTSPILGHPNFDLPFVVYTDASDVGLGAVLAQRTGLGTEEVLAFASRTLNKAERNYSTTEQECLAVVWALEKWRYYLEGRFFTVVTDHSSLVWVFKTHNPSTRLIRWALRLQEFTFAVEYRKGKYNTVPDALSRAPADQVNSEFPPTCATVLSSKRDSPKEEFPVSDETIWKAQQDDTEIQAIYQKILEDGEQIVNSTTKLTIIEDKVYRVLVLPYRTLYQVYIPIPFRTSLLQHFHEHPIAGHLGRFKTYKRMQSLLYWPNLSLDVKTFTKHCQVCQVYKPEGRKTAGMLQQTIVSQPWEMLGVDIMGPFPRSTKQNEYLLVFVDYYSKWVELFALRQVTGKTVSSILIREILTRWGVPEYVLSDRGSQFVSDVFEETCQRWNLKHKLTTSYHPQTNLTERVNRTLKTMIASYVESQHKNWDQHLHEFRFALNSSVQESIGVTPGELNLSRPLRGPLDLALQPQHVSPDSACYNQVVQLHDLKAHVDKNLTKARVKQKRNYDRRRRELQFQVRDRVWLRTHPYSKKEKFFTAKLAPKWQGPYRIVEQLGPLNYRAVKEDTGEDMRVVHVSRLKACYPSAEEVDELERSKVLDILEEESDEETFLGFPDPEVSKAKVSVPSAEPVGTDEEEDEEQSVLETQVPLFRYQLRKRIPKKCGK